MKASDYLDDDDIWRISSKIYTIEAPDDVFQILGCDILPGGVLKLFNCIQDWKKDSVGVEAMAKLRSREAATRLIQSETLIRLQRQQDERAAKANEERAQKENKRKLQEGKRLTDSITKRQKRDEAERRRLNQMNSKARKAEERAQNVRMMAALHSGKTM